MRTRTAIVLSALALLCAVTANASERRVHRTIAFNANGRLSLETHNGTITVTTWNRPQVDVDARIEPGDSDYPEDVDKVEVRISGSGNDVRVESNYDAVPYHHTGWIFSGNSRWLPPVHYNISLPPGASVDIEDHNAIVRVSGVQGDVRVNAHNGRIELNEVGGGTSVTAHNADVRVAFTRFSRNSEIETHNGSIQLRLPNDARFNLNARGHHLDFDSDFPLTARQLSRESYVGDVNGGGPELRVTTHNGSVRLRRS